MILIGDPLVPFECIQRINSLLDIQDTKPNSTVLFSYNEALMSHCFKNNIPYALEVKNIKEAIYGNALHAKYIISQKENGLALQKIAQNYLFDSKILAIITSNEELEEIAQLEIDGVIYRHILV
jgi:hypothetical protein